MCGRGISPQFNSYSMISTVADSDFGNDTVSARPMRFSYIETDYFLTTQTGFCIHTSEPKGSDSGPREFAAS